MSSPDRAVRGGDQPRGSVTFSMGHAAGTQAFCTPSVTLAGFTVERTPVEREDTVDHGACDGESELRDASRSGGVPLPIKISR